MKIAHILSIALLLGVSVSQMACKSTSGEVGPAGPTGPKGETGAAGPVGGAGNANVLQINYAGRSATGGFPLNLPGVDANRLANSAVFCYVQSTNWYQLPGFTFNGVYEYRIFLTPGANSTLNVIRVTSSSGTDTFSAIRVLVIQASSVVNGRRAAVDFSSYEAVKAFYDLPD